MWRVGIGTSAARRSAWFSCFWSGSRPRSDTATARRHLLRSVYTVTVATDLAVVTRQMDDWAADQRRCWWWGVRIVASWVHHPLQHPNLWLLIAGPTIRLSPSTPAVVRDLAGQGVGRSSRSADKGGHR